MKNKIGLLTIFLVSLFAIIGVASALPVTIDQVKINEDIVSEASANKIYNFEKDQDILVKVRVTANANINDVQIEASLRGYDHDDLMQDITDVFDMKNGTTYTKTLEIPLRLRMDQDNYKLRVRIEDRDGATTEETYELEVDAAGRHVITIKDVILSPDYEVSAGRALLTSVRLKNYGEKDEEGIKVKVSIPEFGISASDFVDELNKEGDDDDQTTTEELYMRIPDDAKTGEYTLRVEVTYDDGDKREVKEMPIKVRGSEREAAAEAVEREKTIITLAAGAQTTARGGAEAVYPITITNQGAASKTYTISADGANWAMFRISPSNVIVVGADESKAVNVYAAASANAPLGEQTFSVTVRSGEKVLKEVPMKVNISEGRVSTWSKVKKGLEVGLIVLVILIVILGLIIGYNKLKGEEETKEEETYY